MSIFPSSAFSLEYRPDLELIIGRWLLDLPPPALQGTYEAMLAAAQAHGNCRFWLLDLRRRPVAGPDLNAWFRDQFSPRLAAALGGPLFTAYLAGPHQRPAAESDALELYFRREAAVDAFPQLFESEAEAMTWLRLEQARAGLAPAWRSRGAGRAVAPAWAGPLCREGYGAGGAGRHSPRTQRKRGGGQGLAAGFFTRLAFFYFCSLYLSTLLAT